MSSKVKLSDYAGLLSEKKAKELEADIKKMRSISRLEKKKLREKLELF